MSPSKTARSTVIIFLPPFLFRHDCRPLSPELYVSPFRVHWPISCLENVCRLFTSF